MSSPPQDAVAAALRTFIQTKFKVPGSDPDFTDNVHLFDYGYIDSFGAVDLITFIETQFAVKITASDLVAYPLNTINEISSFVAQRKAGVL